MRASSPSIQSDTFSETPANFPPSTAALANTGAPSPETAAVLAEVQELGQTDSAAQQALLDDLKKTDPSLWPQLVQVFRSSVAYRQQSAVRLAQTGNANGTQPTAPQAALSTPGGGDSPFMRQVGYETTATPNAPALRDPRSSSQILPGSADGLIAPTTPTMDLAARYPDTQMPEAHLINVQDARPVDERAPGDSVMASGPAIQTAGQAAEPAKFAIDWHDQLAATIRALESQTAADGKRLSVDDQARLRLLYAAAGRREEASAVPSGTDSEQQFWNQELQGLFVVLEDAAATDPPRHTGEAAEHLRAAAAQLGQFAPLAVKHLAFCTEVNSFGVYKPFPLYEFKPGQEVLLYAEIENFTSAATDEGYHTALHSSYQILNARGDRVAELDFAITEESCRNQRNDFFVRYFLTIPKNLPPGDYTLQLTVEDTQGHKAGQANIPLSIAK